MRKISLTLLVLIGLTFAQTIKVVETQVIAQKNNQTEYAFPQFSPDGNKILFTSTGYNGLWVHDKNTNETVQLNDLRGAGYKPVFSKDGDRVFFRHDEMVNKRKHFAIAHQSIENKKIENIIENERDISPPKAVGNKMFVYKKDDMPVTISYEDDNNVCLLEKPTAVELNIFTENSNLYLEKNGEKSILNPVGEGHYIWGSLSPNEDKILFTVAGRGTFVTDLEGNVLLNIKNANYPNWSVDGKWFVYMSDKDDGHYITSSDINAVHVATQKTFPLTTTENKIEMYPTWSPVENNILYHTISGDIEMLTVEIQE